MYLRETKRRNADGSSVSYLALAQNERDAVTGVPRARIIHRFGRADQVDRRSNCPSRPASTTSPRPPTSAGL
ncbi:MAG: hypothetical protein ABSG43_31435 [Solirubrobacteraceae bacterium]